MSGPSCPRCGGLVPLGEFGICVPCAADQGWEPECSACLAEQKGEARRGLRHGSTCGPGRSPSVRLRQVERDRDELQRSLAASQQDLTRALAQRDDFIRAADQLQIEWLDLKAEIARLREDLAAAQTARLATERERDEALHDLAHARFEVDKTKVRFNAVRAERNAALAELEQLRTAVAGVLAELRELAAFNRADANRFRGTSSPNGFGPHRAAEAYEKAVALVKHIHPDREEPTT